MSTENVNVEAEENVKVEAKEALTLEEEENVKMDVEEETVKMMESEEETVSKPKSLGDEYFLHFLKYEQCIYVLAIVGAISQILVVAVIVGHLFTGLGITDPDLEKKAVTYSAIGMVALTGTAFSEILLMRAVNQRFLRYIQWWIMSSLVICIFSTLMTVISGYLLDGQALWITLGFLYLVIRLPFQMFFVDRFTNAEIIFKEAQGNTMYKSVLYLRFQ